MTGRAVVMGLGSFGGGAGAARYLAGEGYDVTVTDLRAPEELDEALASLADLSLRAVLGEHRMEDFERADLVVANPAVPPASPYLSSARGAGARVTTEIELFLEAVPARVACVTGTQGKSSTCRMAADFLAAAGFRTHLGGNIGGSLLGALAEMRPDDVCVLELSSYQLDLVAAPEELPARVEAVAITNVLADHLERHGGWDDYARAKRRVLALLREGGTAFLPGDDARLAAWRPARGRRVDVWRGAANGPGLFLEEGLFRWDEAELGRIADLRVPGDFQRGNALFALGLARALGAPAAELARAVGEARGLEHRLEDLGRRAGRRVIDNAVSTTPDSTVAALCSLDAGCTLICGGEPKDLPRGELVEVAAERVAHAVTFGAAAAAFARELDAAGVRTTAVDTVEAAVEAAFAGPDRGDVLFSPACASFDAYRNFRERALAFRAALPPLDEAEGDGGSL